MTRTFPLMTNIESVADFPNHKENWKVEMEVQSQLP